jgi:hypothetical protein
VPLLFVVAPGTALDEILRSEQLRGALEDRLICEIAGAGPANALSSNAGNAASQVSVGMRRRAMDAAG